ncbi:hypothetical protein Peur_058868 [Populus x canadensis]
MLCRLRDRSFMWVSGHGTLSTTHSLRTLGFIMAPKRCSDFSGISSFIRYNKHTNTHKKIKSLETKHRMSQQCCLMGHIEWSRQA